MTREMIHYRDLSFRYGSPLVRMVLWRMKMHLKSPLNNSSVLVISVLVILK